MALKDNWRICDKFIDSNTRVFPYKTKQLLDCFIGRHFRTNIVRLCFHSKFNIQYRTSSTRLDFVKKRG